MSLSSIKYDINLQDGTGLQFKSVTEGKYLCAELGGGNIIVANRTAASGWETFKIWRINSTIFNFRVFNKEFVGVDGSGNVVAVENKPGFSETFEIVRNSDDPSRVRIKSTNGFFLQVKTEELVTADHSGGNGGWGDDDPSVFIMKTSGRLEGEFQITNGYGPIMASQVMRVCTLFILVGEWVAEWEVRDATKEDYQKFAQAQLEVFGRATFGWAYWTLKNVNIHWSEIDEGSSNVMIEYGAPWSKNGDFPQQD
ncbi:hypothetical protein K7X08_007696 [Anisodus acutangulus]|uniref:DUF7910 domain-containing protein n=1 Tax=Anisodus acutangulus TaxID=402998 RepID=A0A9Q1L0J3_9SOLA|nr:hypothetical protein K7X08_007696 [Anisodus acutangulus]